MPDETPSRWIPLAHLLRPQGRRGEILAEPLTDLPEAFAPGQPLRLSAPEADTGQHRIPRPIASHTDTSDSSAGSVQLESSWRPTGRNAGRIVLKLSGCESIDAAEKLSGRDVLISADALPELDADTFFVADLLGCTLMNGTETVGEVVDVQYPTTPDGRTRLADAAPLLAVRVAGAAEDAEPLLTPFIRAWLETVDIPNRRIVMHLPEGLTDLES